MVRHFAHTSTHTIVSELSHRLGHPITTRRLGGSLGRHEVFRLHPDRSVIKVFHHNAAVSCAREASAYTLLHTSGLPVPQLLDRGVFADGTPWIRMSELRGTPLETCQAMPDHDLLRLFATMGELLALLHTFPLPPVPDLHRTKRVQETYRSYQQAVCSARRPEHTLFQQADEHMRRLEAFLPPPDLVCMVHRDFSRRNILATCENERWIITGLIDFEKVCIGDIMEDMAKVAFKEFVDQPDRKQRFLEAYCATNPLPACASERLSYHLYGLLFEIALWAYEDDPPYYQQAVNTLIRLVSYENFAEIG
jgi:aminoglycoside phosphotransferase (APT) family kinase protein